MVVGGSILTRFPGSILRALVGPGESSQLEAGLGDPGAALLWDPWSALGDAEAAFLWDPDPWSGLGDTGAALLGDPWSTLGDPPAAGLADAAAVALPLGSSEAATLAFEAVSGVAGLRFFCFSLQISAFLAPALRHPHPFLSCQLERGMQLNLQ